jgi:hypothetical protein
MSLHMSARPTGQTNLLNDSRVHVLNNGLKRDSIICLGLRETADSRKQRADDRVARPKPMLTKRLNIIAAQIANIPKKKAGGGRAL